MMDDYGRKLIEQGAREEREAIVEIIKNVEDHNGTTYDVRKRIQARGDHKPGKIEHFPTGGLSGMDWVFLVKKVNEIIDRLNEKAP